MVRNDASSTVVLTHQSVKRVFSAGVTHYQTQTNVEDIKNCLQDRAEILNFSLSVDYK